MTKWTTGAAVAAAAAVIVVVTSLLVPARPADAQVPGFLTLQGAGSAIGVTVREATAEDVKAANLAQPAGVVIETVRTSSPAEKAGFRAADLVLEFDGERIRSVRHFTRLVVETPPGRSVNVVVLRGTARQTLSVVPEVTGDFVTDAREAVRLGIERRGGVPALRNFNPNIEPGLVGPGTPLRRRTLGVTLTPLSPQLADYFGVKEGALVASVESSSPAAEAGVKAGDVITAIDGRSVNGAGDVTDALRRTEREEVDISLTRDKKALMLKATVPASRLRVRPSGRSGLPV
jgi:serine protease Do